LVFGEGLPTRDDVPHFQGFIAAAGGELLAVRAEGQAADLAIGMCPDGLDIPLDTELAGRHWLCPFPGRLGREPLPGATGHNAQYHEGNTTVASGHGDTSGVRTSVTAWPGARTPGPGRSRAR